MLERLAGQSPKPTYPCRLLVSPPNPLVTILMDQGSHRAMIRDEVDGYSASTDYQLRCLYEAEKGNLGRWP